MATRPGSKTRHGGVGGGGLGERSQGTNGRFSASALSSDRLGEICRSSGSVGGCTRSEVSVSVEGS
jgi:hypothetical protein